MSIAPEDQRERADVSQIRTALNATEKPLTIRSISAITRNDSMAVALTLREMGLAEEVTRLLHGDSNYYWLRARALPTNWADKEKSLTPAKIVALMSRHDDEPEPTAAPTPGDTMPNTKKPKASTGEPSNAKMPQTPRQSASLEPLSQKLADTLAVIAKYPDGISTADCADSLGINRPTLSKRLDVLKKQNLIGRKGSTLTSRWFAFPDTANTSTSAASNAKMPEKSRKQTTLKQQRKASLASLDATLRGKNKLRTAGPAIIDGVDTRKLLDPTPATARAAITTEGEVLLFDGPLESTTPSIIVPHLARCIADLFRKLPNTHPLAVPA